LNGAEHIPERWSKPIGDGVFVGPGILGIDAPATLDELTRRTARLMGKLEPRRWNGSEWDRRFPVADMIRLPATIGLLPFGGKEPALWANGELPAEVKQAAGGIWSWEKADGEPREILCLAREGARLFLNDRLLFACPAGLPYVPAPHRCPAGSRLRVDVPAGSHRLRVELDSDEATQDASVILTYSNFHLCPWTADELPNRAILPAP